MTVQQHAGPATPQATHEDGCDGWWEHDVPVEHRADGLAHVVGAGVGSDVARRTARQCDEWLDVRRDGSEHEDRERRMSSDGVSHPAQGRGVREPVEDERRDPVVEQLVRGAGQLGLDIPCPQCRSELLGVPQSRVAYVHLVLIHHHGQRPPPTLRYGLGRHRRADLSRRVRSA